MRSPFLFATLLLTCIPFATTTMANDSVSFYIGPYTRGESKGIYHAKLDTDTGKLHALKLAAELDSPSFLALHPTKPVVYAVNEVANFGGEKAGAVTALKRDTKTNELTLLNQLTTKGAHPCHVSVTPCGKFVLVANYSGGSIAAYPVQPDGSLGPMSSFVQHEGSSVSPRQKGPHAHSIDPDPAGRFIYSSDLGCDKVFIYQLNEGNLVPNRPAFATVPPGSGPRHFAIHPKAPFAYVINELLSTVTAFKRDAQTGALTEIQTITTLPDNFDGDNTTAEVRIHPSGKFLYGSNRGHDSIATFSIDQKTGKLTPIGHTPSGGNSPRNFTLDPSACYILAAHQLSDNVVAFRINQETCIPEPTGSELKLGSPVCVLFLPN